MLSEKKVQIHPAKGYLNSGISVQHFYYEVRLLNYAQSLMASDMKSLLIPLFMRRLMCSCNWEGHLALRSDAARVVLVYVENRSSSTCIGFSC